MFIYQFTDNGCPITFSLSPPVQWLTATARTIAVYHYDRDSGNHGRPPLLLGSGPLIVDTSRMTVTCCHNQVDDRSLPPGQRPPSTSGLMATLMRLRCRRENRHPSAAKKRATVYHWDNKRLLLRLWQMLPHQYTRHSQYDGHVPPQGQSPTATVTKRWLFAATKIIVDCFCN